MLRFCFLLILLQATGLVWSQAPVDHVVLISIDGLRPEFYRDSSWPAPTLQHMAKNGASADGVRGVYPTVTYPSHTTMITGAFPDTHGIHFNSPFEPEGRTGAWYWYEKDIQVKTLWDAVKEAGKESASLFWPVSVNAPITYNVPEVWPLDRYEDFLTFVKKNVTPVGLLDELELNATGKLTNFNFNGDALNREPRTAMMAAYLLKEKKPALMTIHLIAVDHFQHEEGRDGLRVRQALAASDAAVELVVDAANRAGLAQRTAFIVTGDHGFLDVHTRISPNRWLVDAGLLSKQGRKGPWRASFHHTAASAFLYLKDPNDQATLDQVISILESLPISRRKLFTIATRDDLAAMRAAPEAALALIPKDGVSYFTAFEGPDLKQGSGGNHGFLNTIRELETGFIGYGAGFRAGAVAKQIGLEDLAPMVNYLLGLNLEAPDGALYPGFFEKPKD